MAVAKAAEDLFTRQLSSTVDQGEDGRLMQGAGCEKLEKSFVRSACSPWKFPISAEALGACTPLAYLATAWGPLHRKIAGTAVSDTGDMGRWEALCLLIAVRAWFQVLSTSTGSLVAVGDALGMLHGAAKFKSKDPGINLIFMELAFIGLISLLL